MKKLSFVAGVVLAASLIATPVAFAQAAAPTCGEATVKLAAAQVALAAAKADDEAAAKLQGLKDAWLSAQAAYDATFAAASEPKLINPLVVEAQAKLTTAKKAFDDAGGQAALTAANTKAALTDAAMLATDAAAAKAVADRACRGADGTVTTTPPPPATFYADCAAVRDAGKAPIIRGALGYRAALDADGDGVGCEVLEGATIPNAINTGFAA